MKCASKKAQPVKAAAASMVLNFCSYRNLQLASSERDIYRRCKSDLIKLAGLRAVSINKVG